MQILNDVHYILVFHYLPNDYANSGSDNQFKLRTMGSDLSTLGYPSCVMISHWSEDFNLGTKDGAK